MTRTPFTAPGFAPVAEAFDALLAKEEELGGALCIYLNGQPVVDLWGGPADQGHKRKWQGDTIVSLFSAGKALLALCLLHLVDRGLARLDDPVVDHWPAFARVDPLRKSEVTLDHLLHHRAGLPVALQNKPGDVFSWGRMVAALENSPLITPAGTETAYHAVTFGHLLGEVIRRISGKMPAEYFAEHFADPLDLDLSLRLLPHQINRLATCDGYEFWRRLQVWRLTHFPARSAGWQAMYYRPCSSDYHPNSKRWQRSEAPAITGFGNARGLARFYALLAEDGRLNGKRLLSSEIIARIATEQPSPTMDTGTGQEVRIGHGVYFNHGLMAALGPNPESFGHVGMGGITSFADPKHGIGFGYVCNHLYQPHPASQSIIGERAVRLAETFYRCLPVC